MSSIDLLIAVIKVYQYPLKDNFENSPYSSNLRSHSGIGVFVLGIASLDLWNHWFFLILKKSSVVLSSVLISSFQTGALWTNSIHKEGVKYIILFLYWLKLCLAQIFIYSVLTVASHGSAPWVELPSWWNVSILCSTWHRGMWNVLLCQWQERSDIQLELQMVHVLGSQIQ